MERIILLFFISIFCVLFLYALRQKYYAYLIMVVFVISIMNDAMLWGENIEKINKAHQSGNKIENIDNKLHKKILGWREKLVGKGKYLEDK